MLVVTKWYVYLDNEEDEDVSEEKHNGFEDSQESGSSLWSRCVLQ